MHRLAALACTALLLAACGQRGALYIPEPRGEPVATQPAASPVPAPATTEEERARREAARTPAN
jgi:predicted small lipoprotein YifL